MPQFKVTDFTEGLPEQQKVTVVEAKSIDMARHPFQKRHGRKLWNVGRSGLDGTEMDGLMLASNSYRVYQSMDKKHTILVQRFSEDGKILT